MSPLSERRQHFSGGLSPQMVNCQTHGEKVHSHHWETWHHRMLMILGGSWDSKGITGDISKIMPNVPNPLYEIRKSLNPPHIPIPDVSQKKSAKPKRKKKHQGQAPSSIKITWTPNCQAVIDRLDDLGPYKLTDHDIPRLWTNLCITQRCISRGTRRSALPTTRWYSQSDNLRIPYTSWTLQRKMITSIPESLNLSRYGGLSTITSGVI